MSYVHESKKVEGRPRLVSADDVAAVLDVSTDTIYRLVRRGFLPAYRVGRALRFDVGRVEEALEIASQADDAVNG